MRSTIASRVVAVLALGLLLAGCTSPGDSTPKGQTASASPSASPSASASATPKDILFTVSANVRAKDGSTIAIQLIAHQPLPYSDDQYAPLEKQFISTCGAGVGGIPVTESTLESNGSILMGVDLASSVVGKQFVYPLTVQLGSQYYGQAATGKSIAPSDETQPCYGGYTWSASGVATGVADFESGNPGPDLTLWKNAFYGFTLPFDSNATIEACKVVLTSLATPTVEGQVGWDPTTPGTGVSCGIGVTPDE